MGGRLQCAEARKVVGNPGNFGAENHDDSSHCEAERERERGGELGAVFCRRCRSVVKPRLIMDMNSTHVNRLVPTEE